VFNSLGDFIALGARHPEFQQSCSNEIGMHVGAEPLSWRHLRTQWESWISYIYWASAILMMAIGVAMWIPLGQGLSMVQKLSRFGIGSIDTLTTYVPDFGNYNEGGTTNGLPLLLLIANSPQIWWSMS